MRIEVSDNPRQRREDGFSRVEIRIEGGETRRLDLDAGELAPFCRNSSPAAADLALLAACCYGIDKLVARDAAPDRWTRALDVTLPVSDPALWDGAKPYLVSGLAFLTGDLWTLTFVPARGPLYRAPVPRRRYGPRPQRPEAVCLFSGGLDSLAGAIDLAEAMPGRPLLLVSHYDAAAGEQADLAGPLRAAYRTVMQAARVRVRLDPVSAPEATLRSRSILFLALGMLAANGAGPGVPLFAYENGHIALNVPLTPSRAGSCSTRTMHPFFLGHMEAVFRSVGLANPLHYPYELKTKGECVTECANQELLTSLADRSVSCSHPSRRQYWKRTSARNCGYCVPCLIRRGALRKAGMDHGSDYGIDVQAGELPEGGQSADDFRAVRDLLVNRPSRAQFASAILRVATVDRLPERAYLLERGFDEVRAVLEAPAARGAGGR